MKMKKLIISNFNGVLDDVYEHYKSLDLITDNPHDAGLFLTWQDVRGDQKELVDLFKNELNVPTLVYQHGRGATRDYCPPNSFPFTADRIMVWGESERMRMLRAGVPDEKISVVGCTLFSKIRPKKKDRPGKNILYVPVISTKEEPENVMVYAALKEWESRLLRRFMENNYDKLKSGWAHVNNEMRDVKLPDGKIERRTFSQEVVPTIPRSITYGNAMVNVKVTPVHDRYQYMAPLILSQPGAPGHVEEVVELLGNVDVMVCLEEGTMQLMASAMDIPIVLVDIFKYGNFGGCRDYDKVEKIKTGAVTPIKSLDLLPDVLDHVIRNPEAKRKERIAVCEHEGGAHLGDANQNIIKIVDGYLNARNLITA